MDRRRQKANRSPPRGRCSEAQRERCLELALDRYDCEQCLSSADWSAEEDLTDGETTPHSRQHNRKTMEGERSCRDQRLELGLPEAPT